MIARECHLPDDLEIVLLTADGAEIDEHNFSTQIMEDSTAFAFCPYLAEDDSSSFKVPVEYCHQGLEITPLPPSAPSTSSLDTQISRLEERISIVIKDIKVVISVFN